MVLEGEEVLEALQFFEEDEGLELEADFGPESEADVVSAGEDVGELCGLGGLLVLQFDNLDGSFGRHRRYYLS